MPQVSYQIVSSVSLSSSYTAYTYIDGTRETSTPSTGSASYGFSYAAAGIPAGSTINSAVFRVESFGSPLHGTAIRGVRVNGTDVSTSIPSATDVDIKPYLTTGDNTITLRFKSGISNTSYPGVPPTTDPNDRTNSSSLAFNDVKVVVNYTPPYTAPSVTVVRLNGTTSVQYGAASSSMTLSWEASNGSYNTISSYSVYRSVNGGAYAALQSGITGTSLSVALPSTAGQNHQYYVVAIGEYSNSAAAYSPQVYAYSSPSAPTAVSISPASVSPGASVSLSWSGANAGVGVPISSYSIRRSTSAAGTYTEVDTSTGASKVFAAPSTPGTYYYKVLTYGAVSGYNSGVSSAYATLTVINPRSTFTLNRTTLPMDNSTQITATINIADSAYTHTVRWYINGTYTQTNTKAAGVASDAFKAPLNWNAAFPAATSGVCYCLLTTLSGGVTVGTYELSFEVTVPASIVPTASIAVSAVNGFGSYYLKGITSATATVTAGGSQGSSIVGYSVSGGGYSGSSSALNTGLLSVLGTNTFSVTVTDSRGRTASASQNITVTNYAPPTISGVSCYRSDSGKNPLVDGTCITAGATFAITSLTGNAITVRTAQYRQSGASTWSSATTLTSGTTAVIATGISIAYAYEVLITLTDTVGRTSTYQGSILVAPKLFDFRNDRAGIGRLATVANRVVFPTNWDIEQHGQTLDQQYAPVSHAHNYASSTSPGGPAYTLLGTYLGSGGQQGPGYFGRERIGSLMMNTPVNGNGNYKNWLIMDSYSGNDVGGATAIGLDRQSTRAFILRSYAERTAWNESAELLTNLNGVSKSGGIVTEALTVPQPFIVQAQSYIEGGEIRLLPGTSYAKTAHLDVYAENFRLHDGMSERLKVDLTNGNVTTYGAYTSVNTYGFEVRSPTGESTIRYNQNGIDEWIAGKGTGGTVTEFGWWWNTNSGGGVGNKMRLDNWGNLRITGSIIPDQIVEFSNPGIPTGNSSTQFRQDVFGNTNYGVKIRPIRTDTGAPNFPIYSSGLAWSTYDTHGFIIPTYNGPRINVGAGSGQSLSYVVELYHTQNFTRGTGYPQGGWDTFMYVQYV